MNELFESHHCLQYKQHLKAYETLNNEYTGFKSASRYCSPIILFSLTGITSRSNESPGEPAHLCSPTRAPAANSLRRCICVVPPGHPLSTLAGAQSVHIILKSSERPGKPAHLYSVARAPTASSLRCLLDTQHKNMPIQYNGPSHGCENENFQVKNVIFFVISLSSCQC